MIDWQMALAWYMYHVMHEEGINYTGERRMKCMPPELKDAVNAVAKDVETLWAAGKKPDGSEM